MVRRLPRLAQGRDALISRRALCEPFDMACMVFYGSFLRSDEEPGWRDIDWHLPPGGQTS